MKELNDYTAEVRRRYEERQQYEIQCRTRRQHFIRTLALCLPLVLCVVAGALLLPPTLSRDIALNPELESTVTSNAGTLEGGKTGEASTAPVDSLESGTKSAADKSDQLGIEVDSIEPPADFSFTFVWNCNGISSYDSATGKLVKTSHATHPEDYLTTLELTAEQKEQIWIWLTGLDLETFPAEYDPYNPPDEKPTVFSEPNRNLILALRQNGKEVTVACHGICLDGIGEGYDDRARAFLRVCDQLTDLLTSTPEWEALPDYEFYYD